MLRVPGIGTMNGFRASSQAKDNCAAVAFFLSDTANQPEFMGLTFKRALNEQLGLSLKPTIAPVDFFVVDHIETPSPN
jgi:uncharacterized protein (TIGR03435 family)